MSSFKASNHPEVGVTSQKWKNPIEKFSKFEMGGEMSRLPNDIVLEILYRISIKDLKQCMWVRKSWYPTIHSPYFIKMHHEKSDLRSARIISMMVQDLNANDPDFCHDLYLVEYELSGDSVTSCGVVPLRTQFKEMNAEYEFVGSSNGLICFTEPSISDPVYVYNPIIGEYMTLPLTSEHPDIDIISGFGFDATTGKFKVIRMIYLPAEHTDDELWYNLEAEIYTVGSKDWRSIGYVSCPPRGDKPGVFLNGVLHWMCDRQLFPEEPYGIVCFDLASEEFSILPPPHGYGSNDIDTEAEDGRFFEIRVLKGQLCYFDRREGNQIVAWVMKQYGTQQSWTQGFSLYDLFNDFQVLNFIEVCLVLFGENIKNSSIPSEVCWFFFLMCACLP